MMTLEEAIIHCEKKAGANTDCSAEFPQNIGSSQNG